MKLYFIFILFLSFMSCSTENSDYLIVAHRGASADAPENTLPAFLLAWDQGSDAIEGDFHITADGVIVCVHDKDTKRVAGADLVVKDVTYQQLKELDAGSWKDPEWEGTYMPTLSEVLATVPKGKKIYVEIKCGTEILPQLYNDLDASGLNPQQFVIISFNAEVISKFKQERPENKAFWLTGFWYNEEGQSQPTAQQALERLNEIGADGISTHHGPVTREFVEQIRNAGYEYHVWTVDDPERAMELIDYGAESITTNVPAIILERLKSK
jgi:glycerophosphoryl diester phosphodiesterase